MVADTATVRPYHASGTALFPLPIAGVPQQQKDTQQKLGPYIVRSLAFKGNLLLAAARDAILIDQYNPPALGSNNWLLYNRLCMWKLLPSYKRVMNCLPCY